MLATQIHNGHTPRPAGAAAGGGASAEGHQLTSVRGHTDRGRDRPAGAAVFSSAIVFNQEAATAEVNCAWEAHTV